MRLVVPLSDYRNYERLINVGADDFYAGFVPFEWINKYGTVNPMNRREYMLTSSQICSMDAILILSKYVKYYGIKVKIVINSHYYLEDQYPIVLDIIEKLVNLGFEEFVIADLFLINLIKKNKIVCKIHVSGEMETLNHYMINYLHSYNITRIVFPRKITIDDMQKCIAYNHSNIKEYEAFILNSLCRYSGGYCNSIHCDNLPATCAIPREAQPYTSEDNTYIEITKKINAQLLKNSMQNMIYHSSKVEKKHILGRTGCGICRIKKLGEIGITHLKIVGRGYDIDKLSYDVKCMSEIIKLSYELSEEEFISHVKSQYINHNCLKCYYPVKDE